MTVLDKCYVTAKTDIYKCCNFPPLGTSDHDAVMMNPRYSPACRSQPIYISRQIWSKDNIEKLIDRLDDTDWSVIFSDLDTIHEQTTAFSDYLSFCIDVCIPNVNVRNRCDKPRMNGNIRRLVAERFHALNSYDRDQVRHLQSVIQCEIILASADYAKSKPAEAWKSLKSVLSLNSSNAGCQFDVNEFNQFYNRFDQPSTSTVVLPNFCDTPDFCSIDDVYFVLKSTNGRKSCGPANIPPKLLKAAACVLAELVRNIFNNSINTGIFPDPWNSANIKPIPKCETRQSIRNF